MENKRNWGIFINSIFFVLGFSLVFSIVGILLQTVLSSVSYTIQEWLGRIGGVIIIIFGLFMLGLIKPFFLLKEHKLKVKASKYRLWTSFLFGAAFAAGWTPCVSAALGAILALAATDSSSAFFLLMSYTLGLGIPFLILGLFTAQAQTLIRKYASWLEYIQYIFGVILIALGVLVFTGQLNRIANFEPIVNIIGSLGISLGIGEGIHELNIINLGIAFFAGLVSFLSPCVLPLLPGFLSYLASSTINKNEQQN